ncbi:MAG: hypothetical protein LBI09_02670, partial [Nitrososphaerota archaeon]|nr:hypothetical protein [Nitrososphaerota archaeon]
RCSSQPNIGILVLSTIKITYTLPLDGFKVLSKNYNNPYSNAIYQNHKTPRNHLYPLQLMFYIIYEIQKIMAIGNKK